MASYLLKTLSRSNQFIRPNSLCKYHKRNSGSTPEPQKEVLVSSVGGGKALHLAVGLSLGLGVSLFFQTNLKDKLFPSEPVKEAPAQQTMDPRIIDEIISLNRKNTKLELELSHAKQDLHEQIKQAVSQIQQQQPMESSRNNNVDIFELSQVIEANNLANSSARKRELEELRKAMVREHLLKLEGEILKIENKYRPVINKIKELETHLEAQKQQQEREAPARILWISCQALLDRMRFTLLGPIEQDPAYDVLKQYAADNNQLAISVLDAIPAKALKQGVESEESLIDRFSRVEKTCKRVALVDTRGGGLAKYLVSYLQSMFIFDNVRISEDELSGKQLIDPTSWSTFDILARVRCCLQRHNLDLATRYANQLRGQARLVARDWIRDARIHLEVKEAFSALSAYAEAVAVDSVRQNFANK